MDATLPVAPLSDLERRLVDGFQRDFPLVARPWSTIAARLGTTEKDVLGIVSRRLADGVLSRVGAVFRPNVIGASTLAAMAVPAGRLEAVAAIVSSHPEVNHNYEREHAVNLWFVATATDVHALDVALDAIEREAGLPVLRLPLVRDYWIDLGFPLDGNGHRPSSAGAPRAVERLPLDSRDRDLVRALEPGLEPETRPFAALGRRAALCEASVLARLAEWQKRGAISRFGLVVHHRSVGFDANAMCVWDVPDDLADAAGLALARERGVTLAYRRARAAGWPYNLYAMIHGRDRAVVAARRDAIAASTGLDRHPHAVLFSTRAFKQRGARYGAPRARELPVPMSARQGAPATAGVR